MGGLAAVLAIQILESVLLISSVCYLLLLLAALLYRDGFVWTVWRWNVFFGLVATVGGYLGVHCGVITGSGNMNLLTALSLGLIGVPRLGGAVTNLILAIHLRRLTSQDAALKAGIARTEETLHR